ncbi:MAG: hypothetical protein IK015_00730 [Treponema sp.]|nr:hypothetical protein [Treponema sp.]
MKKLQSKYLKLAFASLILFFLAFSCSNSSSSDSDDGSYDAAKQVLAKLGNKARIDSTGKDSKGSSVVFFYFTQPVDHNDPSQGTFEQYCALHYKGKNHKTILQTNGYSLPEPKDYFIEDIGYIFDANYIEVEHRYYKRSDIGIQTEDYTGDYWKYNTAAQATADLHEIVTAFKATCDFEQKWISAGLSKNGILTAMYAYKFPNDVDVYVPFGAPFIPGQERPEIGTYLTTECGKQELYEGKTVNDYAWSALSDYLSSTDEVKKAVEAYAKQANDEYKDKNSDYIRRDLTCNYASNLFQKYAYRRWNLWAKFAPSYALFGNNNELYAKCFYIFATTDADNFDNNIEELEKIFPTVNANQSVSLSYSKSTSANSRQSPKEVVENAYYVQAAMELGYYLFDWSRVEDKFADGDKNQLNQLTSNTQYNSLYGVDYDEGALMKGFLKFLEDNGSNTKCKMVFVYGKNDPWTGAAIPDAVVDNTYIKKFIIPQGMHSSNLNDETYYPKEERKKIIDAIEGFLQ